MDNRQNSNSQAAIVSNSYRLHTTAEVSDLTGLSARTVRSYIAQGALGAVRHGKQYYVPQGELERFTTATTATETVAPPTAEETLQESATE